MKKIIFIFLIITIMTNMAVFASNSKQTVGSWETTIYFDNTEIITRVLLYKDNETAVKLRDFCEAIGYSVEWIENESCINLQNDNDKISIFANKYICEKNGKQINLSKSVFIEDDNCSYLPQSFLADVFDIKVVLIDQAKENNRINGLFLADTKKFENDLIIVNSDIFSIDTEVYDTDINSKTIFFNFALGIEKELDVISMDYEQFIKSNEKQIASIVKEELKKTNFDVFVNSDSVTELKINLVNKINSSLNIKFVKYLYITGFSW